MVTLYKRATLSQRKILRMVEGAVKNAGHGHPDWMVTDSMARSIAKRAAGTLSSQLDAVLAVSSPLEKGTPSDRAEVSPVARPGPRSAQPAKPNERGASQVSRRSPLVLLQNRVWAMMFEARMMGRAESEQTCVEVLRIIADLRKSHE